MDKLPPHFPEQEIITYLKENPMTGEMRGNLTDKQIIECVADFFSNQPIPIRIDLGVEKVLEQLSKDQDLPLPKKLTLEMNLVEILRKLVFRKSNL